MVHGLISSSSASPIKVSHTLLQQPRRAQIAGRDRVVCWGEDMCNAIEFDNIVRVTKIRGGIQS